MKQTSHLSLIGSTASLMPSVIRSACRSVVGFDEDAVIEYMADIAIEQLEESPLKYPFIGEHIAVLNKFTPEDVRVFVRRKRFNYHNNMMPFCRFEIEGHKRSCWHCPRVKEIIVFLKGGNDSCQNEGVEKEQ